MEAIEDGRARAWRRLIEDTITSVFISTTNTETFKKELADRFVEVLYKGLTPDEAEAVWKRLMDAEEKAKASAQPASRMVLQDWVVESCTWKQQTVLLAALRGPDTAGTPAIKSWVRWIRRVVLKNAAPHKTFMQDERTADFESIANTTPLALDMLPVHFLSHLMHALQIIGLKGPDDFAGWANTAYTDLCDYLHLEPEREANMRERLRDET